MDRDWSSAADEFFENSTSFVKEDSMFKLHYRGQMICLIRKIILAACEPNHNCTGDTKRETNLKNEMKIVRRMIFPLTDLTSMFLAKPRVNLSNC